MNFVTRYGNAQTHEFQNSKDSQWPVFQHTRRDCAQVNRGINDEGEMDETLRATQL